MSIGGRRVLALMLLVSWMEREPPLELEEEIGLGQEAITRVAITRASQDTTSRLVFILSPQTKTIRKEVLSLYAIVAATFGGNPIMRPARRQEISLRTSLIHSEGVLRTRCSSQAILFPRDAIYKCLMYI